MQIGIIKESGLYELDIREYHAQPALSKTGMSDFARSPLHYKYRREQPKEKRVFDVGNAAHIAILEPDQLLQRVAVPPDDVLSKSGAMSTNAFREWKAERPGVHVLKKAEMANVVGMKDAVFKHPARARIAEKLQGGRAELSGFYEHITTSGRAVWVKFRPDYLPGDRTAVDLKTCRNASPDVFWKDCASLHYHWSAYITLTGLEAVTGQRHNHYYFVAVESEPPHDVGFYRISIGSDEFELAADEVEKVLDDFAVCQEDDDFDMGLNPAIQDVRFPGWRFNNVKHLRAA